jgi:phosphate uptake regulator
MSRDSGFTVQLRKNDKNDQLYHESIIYYQPIDQTGQLVLAIDELVADSELPGEGAVAASSVAG